MTGVYNSNIHVQTDIMKTEEKEGVTAGTWNNSSD